MNFIHYLYPENFLKTMKTRAFFLTIIAVLTLASCQLQTSYLDEPAPNAVPEMKELRKSFGKQDVRMFQNPSKQYRPETWFHYINGNVDKDGITADLEAIAQSGLAGVQFFHGGGIFADNWKGVKEPVYCLSENWEDLVTYTASEAQLLKLRFSMLNCPGWSMSGGPWIDFDHAMRRLVRSTTQVEGGKKVEVQLARPSNPAPHNQDYRDLMVLAFPTPIGEGEAPLWTGKFQFEPTTPDQPQVIDVKLPKAAVARTMQTSDIHGLQTRYCCNPDIHFRVEAIDAKGEAHEVLSAECPTSNWEDLSTMSYPLTEVPGCSHYKIYIYNQHPLDLKSISLLAAAKQPNWEGDAGWTARTILHTENEICQTPEAYVKHDAILDLTDKMDVEGNLSWDAPQGKWTVLRIGHENNQRVNMPAPKEATGWECNKLDPSGADVHFQNYIGKYASGCLKGLVSNMLLDSWECLTQTWTEKMPEEFHRMTGYELRTWMPALFGYVLDDNETTARFLCDWRVTQNDLYVNSFYGEMAKNAHEAGLTCTCETAAGDIIPADPLEYYKHADVPMCEFWQPYDHALFNREFKPIRPTASAAHMYGKPRVSAESFTSFKLTWDEHWQMFKDIANENIVDGVTHFVLHAYTHNPGATEYFPGSSLGADIGSPFLRGETWWKHMPAFTSHLARCTYLLERGVPVNTALWYVGDEPQQKPRQLVDFPEGFHFEYSNPDALLTRLSIQDGAWTTPDGISYPIFWIPVRGRMRPETVEKLQELVNEGGILLADAPTGLSTLSSDDNEQARYDAAVSALWGDSSKGVHELGKGKVLTGMNMEEALQALNMIPDVKGLGKYWLHRRTEGADWYFVCPPAQKTVQNKVTFHNEGRVEIWNPVNGCIEEVPAVQKDGFTTLDLDMAEGECLFVVFRHDGRKSKAKAWSEAERQDISGNEWTLTFPEGWGIDAPVTTTRLLPWKELATTEEGKSFSGTVTYRTTLSLDKKDGKARYVLQLGKVDQIAVVRVNGKELGTVWSEPYECNVTDALRKGENQIEIDVTSSWYNRLVYDASLPEEARKTWVIKGPEKDESYKDYGLMGPVILKTCKKK